MFLHQQGFLFGEVQSPYRLKHHSYEDWPGNYTFIFLCFPQLTLWSQNMYFYLVFYHAAYVLFL